MSPLGVDGSLHCIACGAPLTGGVDTYGPIDAETCWACYAELAGEPEMWYGLAPHVHDSSQGIGVPGVSTQFLPLTPDEEGRYVLDDGTQFIPDADTPGLGFYCPSRLIGWR